MLFNRHLFVIVFSIFFIGVIVWWQNPSAAVSAMASGDYSSNPYSTVKNYWKRLDYRQFDLALEMIGESAKNDHAALQRQLSANPFLSIQKLEIADTPLEHTFEVKTVMGSVIDPKTESTYIVNVDHSDKGWVIASIKRLD